MTSPCMTDGKGGVRRGACLPETIDTNPAFRTESAGKGSCRETGKAMCHHVGGVESWARRISLRPAEHPCERSKSPHSARILAQPRPPASTDGVPPHNGRGNPLPNSRGRRPLPGTALLAGWCTTNIRRPSSADLQRLPASRRSQVIAKVTLSERWGIDRSATFTFIVGSKGEVLSEKTSGHPPQFWL